MTRWSATTAMVGLRRLSWPLRRRLGPVGLLGLVLLVAAVAMAGWHGLHRAEDAQALAELTEQLRARQQELARLPSGRPERAWTGTWQQLPTMAVHASDLRVVLGVADGHKLQIERADYQVVHQAGGALTIVSATLPLRGGYKDLKQFAADVLSRLPHVALQDLRLERTDIGAGELRSRVRLAFYYRAAQAPDAP